MGSFGIHGLMHDGVKPMIVRSLTQSGADLLDLEFELKPRDGSCDQRVTLSARPTEIVYDAVSWVLNADTINFRTCFQICIIALPCQAA